MGDLINTQGGDYAEGNVDKRSGTFTTVAIHEAPAPLALNLHQIPPSPRDFTGREAELTELLANFEKGIAISGLHGQGGIGKTALAYKLAEHLTPRYPDAQFYLDLKGVSDKPLNPAEALSHVIRAYHPTSKLPEDEAQLRALYQSVLHNQRALLLMDNAKDKAQVESLLPPATCCLIVTSRQHFKLAGMHLKNLEEMPPDDARQLLIKIAARIGDHADEIARLCGYLPLALRVTASTLAERIDLSPADYIRRLSDTRQRLNLMNDVEASLQLSYDLLTPELQKLWRALAVFPETFDRAAATAVWAMEADPAQDVLSELVKFSLLDYSPHSLPDFSAHPTSVSPKQMDQGLPSPIGVFSDGGRAGDGGNPGRYRLHDLARLYADSRLPEPERYEAQQRHATHYAKVFGRCNQLLLRGGADLKSGLSLFETEQPNIHTGQKWASRHTTDSEAAAQACNWYGWQGSLLGLRFHPRDQIRWMEAALNAARQLKNRQAEGAHLGNLGIAYYNLGETRQAIEYYDQILVIHREIGDRRGEGADLNNLGLAYADLGETHKAIGSYEQALPTFREIGDRRGEGNTLGNLGIAYAALGETHKAIEYHEQDLTIRLEIGDRRGEGNAMGNLGLAYKNLGETHKAIEYYEQCLTIAREIGDRRGEGIALWNMSLALDKLGERAQAIAHAEAALKIYEEIESPYAEKVRKQLEAWRAEGVSSG
jgi:tetratricopeptide (TPR) repeat protein